MTVITVKFQIGFQIGISSRDFTSDILKTQTAHRGVYRVLSAQIADRGRWLGGGYLGSQTGLCCFP